ncbi:Immunity protein 64 [Fontibacillus panacisegetis]|uniref:Immunity protein 64 n=1 Tax=Fontibacillus panacisegetis TaxID=670482 RepID=A0A1G7VJE4_9BACL|nr:Imm64 family immunity protein [Fontibacillus panacisegetis]SDG59688.1 Immunity protein 64 [Fontibacillus panacisegetis]
MGSTINIGLVYNDSKAIGKILEKLLGLVVENNGHFQSVKFCEDYDGESWIELDYPNMDTTFIDKMTKSYFVQIQSCLDLFQIEQLKTDIRIEKYDEFFGLLLLFNEDEILPNYSIESLEKITNSIINFIVEVHPVLNFDYAFCDHEAEIEYSPKEFKPEKYSLSFLPNLTNGVLGVRKSSWEINGLTERR